MVERSAHVAAGKVAPGRWKPERLRCFGIPRQWAQMVGAFGTPALDDRDGLPPPQLLEPRKSARPQAQLESLLGCVKGPRQPRASLRPQRRNHRECQPARLEELSPSVWQASSP